MVLVLSFTFQVPCFYGIILHMPKAKNHSKKNKKTTSPGNLEDIKSDFITVASHQLRTPISAIRWSLDTLMSGRVGELTDKQKEIANEAYQNNKFMIKVVNDLLRVSRIEEKGINLIPEFVNLNPIITEIVKKYEDLASAFNCKITFRPGKNVGKAYVDPIQIKSVIEALVDNAVRYTKVKGKINIALKKIKDEIVFTITDNGIGIPEKEKGLVFSKFYRGTNAIKAQTEGLGLDLYVIKKIVNASQGRIEFKSKKNIGTSFSLYLPAIKKQVEVIKIDKAEEVEVARALKKEREFVSITVHELKAPLGITKWSLEMLQSQKPGKLNDNQLELIGQVYRGNERLLVLVRDLLNLSKLQEGKFEIDIKKISFASVVTDVVRSFKAQTEKKELELAWNQAKANLPKVNADQARVVQVVTNLVSNAVKYTPEKGRVEVKLEKKTGQQLKNLNKKSRIINIQHADNKNGYLVMSVKDTGIGISAKDQKKLFTRFFRSRQVLKSEAEGTGLGLYITKSIVNLHQGDIWFTSKLGKGSTFYFSLPIA